MRNLIALRSDERGVSGVVVATCLVALFSAAMLSVDAGNMWQTRRNIITGTDSSALQEAAIASLYTSSPTSCTPAWATPISGNSGPEASAIGCSIFVSRTTAAGVPIMGYVVVDARKTSKTRFGGVVGIGDTQPYSLSAALWGPPLGVTGLRPFGLCDQEPHYQEWLNYAALGYPETGSNPYNDLPGTPGHPVILGAGVVHRIIIDDDGGTCGDAPGNWAWLDYDSSSNPTGAQRKWWETGYTPNVRIHTGPDCTLPEAQDGDTSDGCIPGNTGNRGNSFDEQFEALKISGHPVPIMIFSHLTGQGQISIFQAVAFLSVIVRDYDVHGNEHHLDLEFVRHNWGGLCCNPDAPDNGTRVVALCDVDHNQGSPASNCS